MNSASRGIPTRDLVIQKLGVLPIRPPRHFWSGGQHCLLRPVCLNTKVRPCNLKVRSHPDSSDMVVYIVFLGLFVSILRWDHVIQKSGALTNQPHRHFWSGGLHCLLRPVYLNTKGTGKSIIVTIIQQSSLIGEFFISFRRKANVRTK